MELRKLFIDQLSEYAEKDDKVILITMDVGFNFIEDFAKRFPKQFLNLGITEQSATGIAAGLSRAGMKPWLYSMINFVTIRNYEQLRNDICYPNNNVKIIGVKGSEAYKFLGVSHNVKLSERRILAPLPNLVKRFPATEKMAKINIKQAYESKTPFYIQL